VEEPTVRIAGTACPLCDLTDGFHHLTDFVGAVHINLLSEIPLQRIEDQELCIALQDRLFNSTVQQMQRSFILTDIDDSLLIGTGFGQPRLDGILQAVLCRLIDHVKG